MTKIGISTFALAVAMVGSGFGSTAAQAQSTSPSPPSPSPSTADTGLTEIIVTAQKREQRLQDVPVAVTSISQTSLQVNRVTTVMDLNGLAPGLLARQNAGSTGTPSYSMRGIFASASDPSQDRQIATYIDGVYIGGIRGAVFDLPDIKTLEVLRGPQGTLFGRNATAGAVNITTRDPDGKVGFRQEISAGNHNSLRTRSTFDTPQMGIFSAFVTYVHDERRGDIRNLGAGTELNFTSPLQNIVGITRAPTWLGSKNTNSVFAALKMEPSDTFNVSYKFSYSYDNNTPDARVPLWNGALLGGIVALQGGDKTYGGYVMPAPSSNPQRPAAVNNAFSAPGFTESSLHVLTANWLALDNLSFKSVTGYHRASALGISSIMGDDGLTVTPGVLAYLSSITLAPGFTVPAYTPDRAGQLISGYAGINYGKYSQFSQELQATYHSQLLTVTAGALYFKSNELSSGLPGSPTNFGILVGLGAIGQGDFGGYESNLSLNTTAPFPLGDIQEKHQRSKSEAAYAQGEIHVTPKLDVVLGGRVTHDDKSQTFILGGTYSAALNALTGTTSTTTPFKKTKPTFSVGADYKATRDVLVYAKYSTAFLSGGASGPLTFQPETVKSVEAGLKSEFFDHRLRFNLALYNANYANTQSAQSGTNVQDAACGDTGLPVSCTAYGVVVISNGKIQARGFEAELTVAPVAGLTLGSSVGYDHVKFLDPSPQVTDGGRPYQGVALPKWIGNVNAQYVTPALFGDATLLFRLDANYQGKYLNTPFLDIATHPADATTDPAEALYATNPSQWLLNGRVALRNIALGSTTAEIAVWGRNLTDCKNSSYTLVFGAQNVNSSFIQARTVGADFIVNF